MPLRKYSTATPWKCLHWSLLNLIYMANPLQCTGVGAPDQMFRLWLSCKVSRKSLARVWIFLRIQKKSPGRGGTQKTRLSSNEMQPLWFCILTNEKARKVKQSVAKSPGRGGDKRPGCRAVSQVSTSQPTRAKKRLQASQPTRATPTLQEAPWSLILLTIGEQSNIPSSLREQF